MEPKIPASGPSVEVGVSSRPEAPRAPDNAIVKGPEQSVVVESREVAPQPASAPPQKAQPALPPPVQSAPVQVTQTAQGPVAVDDNPIVASDDDLIEREWVQKAKKIVSQTREDPYAQEKEVSRLQADYIKKRYGKEIKVTIE